LLRHVVGNALLHEVESGSWWRFSETGLNNVDEEVAKGDHTPHSQVRTVLGKEGNSLALEIRNGVVEELKGIAVNWSGKGSYLNEILIFKSL
jgi:hypothetical protein